MTSSEPVQPTFPTRCNVLTHHIPPSLHYRLSYHPSPPASIPSRLHQFPHPKADHVGFEVAGSVFGAIRPLVVTVIVVAFILWVPFYSSARSYLSLVDRICRTAAGEQWDPWLISELGHNEHLRSRCWLFFSVFQLAVTDLGLSAFFYGRYSLAFAYVGLYLALSGCS